MSTQPSALKVQLFWAAVLFVLVGLLLGFAYWSKVNSAEYQDLQLRRDSRAQACDPAQNMWLDPDCE